MKNNKTIILSVLVLLFICFTFIYLFKDSFEPTPTKKLIIGIEKSILSSAVYIADNNNYFKKAGLDIKIVEYESGKASFNAMLNNEVDVSTVAPTPVMFKSFIRDDYAVFSTYVFTYEDMKVIARTDKGIQEISDLAGKKIGTPFGTTGQFFSELFLSSNNILPQNVKLVDIRPNKIHHSIAEGKVDAVIIWEPHGTKALKLLKDKVKRLPTGKIYKATFNFVSRKNYININHQALKIFLNSINKAINYINNNNEESIKIISNKLNIDINTIKEVFNQYNFTLSLDQSLISTLEDGARWAINNKLVNKSDVPNYLNYVYTKALHSIRPEAVGIYTTTTDDIIIAEANQPIAAPIYIAFKNKYFYSEGLNVKLKTYTSGKACLKALSDKQAHFATVADIPLMFAILNKKKIYIIATFEHTDKNLAIVARKDSNISSVKDLKNKTIAVTKGTGGEYLLDTLLILNKLTINQVKVVYVKPEEMFQKIVKNNVDAVVTWNPHLIKIQKYLKDKQTTFTGKGSYRPTFNLTARQKFINSNKELTKRIISALIKAEEFIKNKPEESRKIVSEKIKMDLKLINELWDIYNFEIVLDEYLLLTLRNEARWAIRRNLSKTKIIPDFSKYIYTDALKENRKYSVSIEK